MDAQRLSEKLKNYKKALDRLKEAVEETNINQYVYDSIIQRFEFSYELSWKTLKAFFEYKGLDDIKFPKDIFKEAFSAGIIGENEFEIWNAMIKDRNITSHTYDEEDAAEVCDKIKGKYFSQLWQLYNVIEREIQK